MPYSSVITYFGWVGSEFDTLIQNSKDSVDLERDMFLYDAYNILHQSNTVIPLAYHSTVNLVSKNLKEDLLDSNCNLDLRIMMK